MHNGETYVLYKSASVRQSIESEATGGTPQVVTESLLDLESQQKSSVCEVCSLSDQQLDPILTLVDRSHASMEILTRFGLHSSGIVIGSRPINTLLGTGKRGTRGLVSEQN